MSGLSDMAKAFSPAYMAFSAMKKDKPPAALSMPTPEPMGSFLEDGSPKRRKPTSVTPTGSFLDGAKYS